MEANKPSIMFNHQPAVESSEPKGIIYLKGEINEDTIMQLLAFLKSAFKYYQYDFVDIKLNSPGGQVNAMYFITEQFEIYKKYGKIISTTALFHAASAAAFILTCGSIGYRSAHYNSLLLYHYSRFNIKEDIFTKDRLEGLMDKLSKGDEVILKSLANIAISTLDYFDKNFDEEFLKNRLDKFIEQAKKLKLISEENELLKHLTIENFIDKDKIEDFKKALSHIYDNLLKTDKHIYPRQAVNLFLIDRVGE